MTPDAVDALLRDFARRATRARDAAPGVARWHFSLDGHDYALHFYPRGSLRSAKAEFAALQSFQKLAVPAPRVLALLNGFQLGDERGDATILLRDDRHAPLSSTRDRRETIDRLIALLEQLHTRERCPTPLTADALVVRADGGVALADALREFGGFVDAARLAELDASTRAATTAGERLRVWRHFTKLPPPNDRGLKRSSRQVTRRAARGEDAAFATILFDRAGERWVGRSLRRSPTLAPWSVAASLRFSADDLRDALPRLLDASDAWPALKDDAAASVREGRFAIAGAALDLIVKRPLLRSGPRGIIDSFRPARVRRTWLKTWRMLALGFRCEVPIAAIERRVAGRLVDQRLIVERVPGETLAAIDLASVDRASLLYDTGRVLRRIESFGFTHQDAKATNWIAWPDPSTDRVRPVLIDLDGIRFRRARGIGYARLLRAMKARDGVTADDLAALERGYRGGRR